jgi:crotonobetainyl-CoA:carnitine CoA-transferase CaiB-like acyl-CoA transferase
MWHSFLEVIGAPDLNDDPRFSDPRARAKNKVALREICEAYLRKRPSAEWIERLNAAGVPCGPIFRVDETFADPHIEHLRMYGEVDAGEAGPLRLLRSPINFSHTQTSLRRAAPRSGQDTDAILRDYGYGADEIARLRASGAIGFAAATE